MGYIVYYFLSINEPLMFSLLHLLRKRILFFQEYIHQFFFDAEYFGSYIEIPVIKVGAEKRFVSSVISNISIVFVKELIKKKFFLWWKSCSKHQEEESFDLLVAKEISQWKQDWKVMSVDDLWILYEVPLIKFISSVLSD